MIPFKIRIPLKIRNIGNSTMVANDDGFSFSWALASLVPVIPGAVQGATTTLLGHPLDTLKTRQQTMYKSATISSSSPAASSSASQPKLFSLAATMLREEGVLSFYRGVVPPLVIAAVKRSAQLTLFEKLTATSSRASPRGGNVSAVGNVPEFLTPFLSGAIAGASGTVLGCPMNVIKIQTQDTSRHVLRNAWFCTMEIFRSDGPLGFYRGWKQQLLKDCCFAGLYLGLYATLKGQLIKARKRDENVDSIGARLQPLAIAPWEAFLAGSCASMFSWIVLFPLDTLKTRAQSRRRVDMTLARTGGGIAGWYKGLGAALLRAGPVNGAAMIAYEATRGCISASI